MRHAEAIAERISFLGRDPTPEPLPVTLGSTLTEILGEDKNQRKKRSAYTMKSLKGHRKKETKRRRTCSDES